LPRALAISLLCVAALLAACGGGGAKKTSATRQSLTTSASRASGCTPAKAPTAKPRARPKRPRRELDAKRSWALVVETNCGPFTIALDLERAPRTAASLVTLARSGFFDGTVFHRIVPGFVIQGGDPTGTGKGGPGYTTVDRPPASARYTRGVVAMAKTADEPAGSAGSQFFVVTGMDAGLPPDYAVVGRVTVGLDVVERIGRLGDPTTERPTRPVVISRMVVQQG
jgi:cyclophilin family peptidyl-prolyl cis-trans isomerase